MRVIPFGSLGGEGIIKGFLPDIVEIDGKPSQQSLYIGICENILKGDVRAIIPFEPVKNI
jgi:stage II sporulation protein GA (sporulation sigma-E factor processing peptidase)